MPFRPGILKKCTLRTCWISDSTWKEINVLKMTACARRKPFGFRKMYCWGRVRIWMGWLLRLRESKKMPGPSGNKYHIEWQIILFHAGDFWPEQGCCWQEQP